MPILAVAPHWGAWIEISLINRIGGTMVVAPHWGAWIEIFYERDNMLGDIKSHPTGVRGLK